IVRVRPLCSSFSYLFCFFFFFQAEDGIRDFHVTGVQTCALPIFKILDGCTGEEKARHPVPSSAILPGETSWKEYQHYYRRDLLRSEERRVGKECRSRWSREYEKKKTTTRRGGGGT